MTTFYASIVRFGLLSAALLLFFACPGRSAVPAHESANGDATATNLVRAALERELAGHNDQREVLLQAAILQSPNDPTVHWQLGEVRGDDNNAWLSTSQVELAAQKDRRLTEYRQRRDAAGPTLPEQVALAQWCRKNKLENEERVHWLFVLQMQPNYPEAIQRLDLHPFRGMMLANEQIAQRKRQTQKLGKSLERWRPLIAQWQRALDRGETSPPAEVREKIVNISVPEEMLGLQRAIVQEAGGSNPKLHVLTLALAQSLSDNPHPAAAECLTRFTISSAWEDVRTAAIAGLKPHPLDHYAPLLLAGLQTRIVADVQFNVNGNGNLITRYSAFREGALADFEHTALDSPDVANRFDPLVIPPLQDTGNAIRNRQQAVRLADWLRNAIIDEETQYRRNLANSQAQAAQKEAALCDAVADANHAIAQSNARIVGILNQTTGLDLGEEPMKWWTWWWQEYNDTYDITGGADETRGGEPNLYVVAPYVSESSPKPVYRSDVVKKYAVVISRPSLPSAQSCFAPGTMVWTQWGRQPIEKIKAGDRVLAQNVNSGELAYKPVLAATVRRPGPRMKVGLGAETITATPSHPFWVDGKGWLLTKQLEVGKNLHTLSGGLPIESLEKVEADPSLAGYSYNLIVADFNSYFVGEQGILVHDNTPREPTSALIPGLPAEAPAAEDRAPE